ncbi:iron ABC transporter permease [Alphaproteobacteria bacterium]|nr:iron ABC transporter permease [Alphaproteobacteria bacterium]
MVAAFLSNWRFSAGQTVDKWSLLVLILCAILLGPVAALVVTAFGDSGGLWPHLLETVLGRYVLNTLVLMLGVGVLAVGFGVSTAWVVSRYEFSGRHVLEWMLLLPAAIPAYIIAYTYTDFFEYAGPLQAGLRDLFDWTSPRDYWFPEIRSLGGAMLVMASVLYPYIYMVTRIAFKLTSSSLFEIALVHNKSQFWTVGLPLARPAIMAGLALVLMEVVSDFGTVEYFAIETLTLGIFNVWLGMNNIVAAAQISIVGFVFILSLLGLEIYARSRQQYAGSGRSQRPLTPLPIGAIGKFWCYLACLTPLLFGFFIPVGVLLKFVFAAPFIQHLSALSGTILNSVMIAMFAAILVMLVSATIVLTSVYRASEKTRSIALVSSTGYAFPGTMLAIGVLIFASTIDRSISGLTNGNVSGLLVGGFGVLMLAYLVRFQAVGYGAMLSGARRLPANMMNASRVLGQGFSGSLIRVILPLLRGSVLAGGLLVFVDVMKELPMTLLLRPFDFETLASFTYQFAKEEMLETAALPALMIVVVGLVPVLLMNRMLRRIS